MSIEGSASSSISTEMGATTAFRQRLQVLMACHLLIHVLLSIRLLPLLLRLLLLITQADMHMLLLCRWLLLLLLWHPRPCCSC